MAKLLKTKLRKAGGTLYRLQDRALENASKYNYGTAKAYYHRQMARREKLYDHSSILVFQMGKVGSSTVARSLRQIPLNRRVFHVHTLLPKYIDELEEQRRSWLRTEKEHHLKHVWQYQYLRNEIKAGIGEPWKVITLVRDPVARNISTFFTNIAVVDSTNSVHTLHSDEYQFEIKVKGNDVSELIDLFFEKIWHDYPLRFFDLEFKELFGIDLLEEESPIEKGYGIYQTDRADILLLRLESLNQCAQQAFSEFLGIKNFTLENANVGSQKKYAELYRQVQKSIVLPESYLDTLYDSQFAKHFYSETELAAFRAKWIRPSDG